MFQSMFTISKTLFPAHFIRDSYSFYHRKKLYKKLTISFDMSKPPLKSFICKAKILKSSALSTLFAVSLVQKNSPLEFTKNDVLGESIKFSHRVLMQQACSNSVNSTSELLTQILMAIIDTASKYKVCMNDLMNDLEQDIELIGHGVVSSKTEDDIIATRVIANNLKEEFFELITLSENIQKLAATTAEISFLIGAETLAMLVSERLYSVQQKIRNEIEEVKRVERKCLEIQKSSIIRIDTNQSSNAELSHSSSDLDTDM